MKVLFCTSNTPGAALIRWFTWSEWSHVALIDSKTDTVIEAVWPEVRAVPLGLALTNHEKFKIVDLYCEDEEAAIKAAYSQVGKPYDLTALIGMPFRRDWSDDRRWFCAEGVAWAFEQGKTPLFRKGTLNRVTPQHLWMLNPNQR